MSALRFLYKKTLKRHDLAFDDLVFPKKPKKLPVVLSPEEVARLIEATPHLMHRTILMVLYGTGIRRTEASLLNDKEALRVIPVAEYWGRVSANARSRGSTRMLSNASTALTAPPSSKSWARALLSTIICPFCTSENNGAELKSRYLDINSGTQINHISSS